MSRDPLPDLYPIMVVEDRYQGVYSGGRWWAVACGNAPFEGVSRLMWLMERGPGADDVSCGVFWGKPPPWIAVGQSAEAAIAALVGQPSADRNDWTAPRWQDDPRGARWIRMEEESDRQ